MTPEVLHSSSNSRWVTPIDVIEAARSTMGCITCDPASEEFANKVVKSDYYFTEQNNGLDLNNLWTGNVWLNPPGDKRGELPKLFWQRLLNEWKAGKVTQAFFLLFSLNQLQTLQDIEPPTNYPVLFFRKRLKFTHAGTGEIGNQPAQANALVYLPPTNTGMEFIKQLYEYDLEFVNKFKHNFSKFGAISVPR